MHILCVTQWFEPEPTFKGLVFARALQSAGHEVEVITGFPNYPAGKVYPGYRVRWFQREMIGGVRVNRVPLYPSHSSSAIGRAWNYISFAISSCVYGIIGARKADVIYAYHPPLTVSLSAVVIGMIRRVPVVVDINDLWPDTLRATGMLHHQGALDFIGRICGWVYGRAASVVVGTPGLRQRLIDRGVPPAKIEIIYNWCDEDALLAQGVAGDDIAAMAGRFNVVFAGNMGKAQALDAVIQAAKRVERANSNVQFVFVGGGIEVDHLKALATRLECRNVLFLPRMPVAEVGRVLDAAQVLLVHLKDDPLFEITLPSKTQAYMRVGKPILVAVKGDAAALVADARAGRAARPEDEASIASEVLALADTPPEVLAAMGENGADYYARNLSVASGTEQFLSVFTRVARSGNVVRPNASP